MPVPTNPNRGNLDQTQIMQRAFDEAADKLRVDASVSIASISGDVAVEIDAADGDNIAIANADGSKKASITTVDAKNGLDVNVINFPSFEPPHAADAFTVDYPDTVTEIYKFRSGGTGGTVLTTVTVIYTNATKTFMLSGTVT